jgi:DUF2407 ubiquitin-like domain/DUF2407 C-terminal domain/AMP-binding enzyme C-terminal domain
MYHYIHDDVVKAKELIKELQDFVKKGTGPYKYPRAIEFVKELPKTVSGKIRRIELRLKEWEGHGSDGKKLSKLWLRSWIFDFDYLFISSEHDRMNCFNQDLSDLSFNFQAGICARTLTLLWSALNRDQSKSVERALSLEHRMEANGSPPGPSTSPQDVPSSSSTRPPGPPAPPVAFRASIRFSSSALPDLEITVPNVNETPLPTVSLLKQQIRFLRPQETQNRRLRLILSGKVLRDPTPLRIVLATRSRRPSIPAFATLKGKEKEIQDRLWIHCSIGELLTDEEFEQGEVKDNQTQSTLPQLLGFDRLRSAGFTDDDIASLRAQFQRFHGSREGNGESVDVTALEERWLDETIGMGGSSGAIDGPPSDSYEETLLGFFIGYFAVFVFEMVLILGSFCIVFHLGAGNRDITESKTGYHRGGIYSLIRSNSSWASILS